MNRLLRFAITPTITLLLAVVAVWVYTGGDPDEPLPPPDYGKVGVHLLLDDGRNNWPLAIWRDHMAYAAQIVPPGGYVVQVVRSDDLNPARWQSFMDLCAEFDLTPVIRLATTFDFDNRWWNPPVPDADGRYFSLANQYAGFINALTWPTERKHIIIHNEPNNGHEWGGQPDPAAYAALLVDTADVLRQRVPGVVMLNGAFDLYAPDTNGQPFPGSNVAMMAAPRFMDAMIAAEPTVFDQIDIWASHPYPLGAFIAPPWESAYRFDAMNGATLPDEAPPDGVHNRGVNAYEWELWKLAQYGLDPLPVLITETGWRHSGGDAESLDFGEGYPSPELMAEYLDMAMVGNDDGRYPDAPKSGWTPWLRDERVIGVALFALNGIPAEWSHTNLLAIDADGRILGTHAPFDLLREYRRHLP